MIDENKIISESEIPIPVPSTDEAWKAMLKKLEDDSDDPAAIVPSSNNSMKWITGLVLISILMLAIGWFLFTNNSNKDREKNAKELAGIDSGKSQNNQLDQSINASQKNEDDINGIKNDNILSENNNSAYEVRRDNSKENKLLANNTRSKFNSERNQRKNNKSSAQTTSKNKKKGASVKETHIEDVDQSLAPPEEEYFKYSSIDYPLLSGGPIRKPLFPKIKIPVAKADEPEPVQNSYWSMEAGLEWNLPVPFASARNIMDGPNGNFQPYRILLPGAWIRMNAEKHSMSLGVNPFYTALLPNKSFEIIDSVSMSADTTSTYVDSKTLRKLFGLSAAFEYNYNLTDRLWVGVGIQSTFWGNGLVGINNEIRKVPLNGSPTIITTNQSERSIYEEEWNQFSKTQIGLTGQFFYRKKPWDAGLRFSLPITPLAKQEGPSNPFRAEFLFRVKLVEWRIKQ